MLFYLRVNYYEMCIAPLSLDVAALQTTFITLYSLGEESVVYQNYLNPLSPSPPPHVRLLIKRASFYHVSFVAMIIYRKRATTNVRFIVRGDIYVGVVVWKGLVFQPPRECDIRLVDFLVLVVD